MAKTFNPFEHHHHHDHDHDHGDHHAEALDPAQESLGDALRVSFAVLKVVMLILLVWYLFSGVFKVEQQEVKVKLRFGNIVGDTPAEQVRTAGRLYFGWPYPIEQVIRIDTTPRFLNVDQAFYFEIPPGSTPDQIAAADRPLNPERDGYVVTADASIVHLKLIVQYNVGRESGESVSPERVIQWLHNVGNAEKERELMRLAVERGTIGYAATHAADSMIDGWSEAERNELRDLIQKSLDEARSGLVTMQVTVSEPMVPPSVRMAFNEVVNAESEKRQAIEGARSERARILGGVAGAAHEALWGMIEGYQKAREQGRAEESETRWRELSVVLTTLTLPDGTSIGGEVASRISAARTYRTQIIQSWQAEITRFNELVSSYEKFPNVTIAQLEEEYRRDVLSGDVRLFLVTPGKPVLQLGPDPRQAQEQQVRDARPVGAAGSATGENP